MDFALSAKAADYHKRLTEFMVEHVFPAEKTYDEYRAAAGPDDHTVPPVVEELKALAKKRGLWNLFLPSVSGLTNLEYAPLAELSGWSTDIARKRSTAPRPIRATWRLCICSPPKNSGRAGCSQCWTARFAARSR
jgi:acyl-CoA dehydrogenase